jgi:Flp pilus assembly pilin Flp
MLDSMVNRVFMAYAALQTRARREEGQALVEYALIVSLIAIAAVAVLQLTGNSIVNIFTTIKNEI